MPIVRDGSGSARYVRYMPFESWVTVIATSCAYAWMICRNGCHRVLLAQGAACVCGLYLTLAFYSPLVSRAAYEWQSLFCECLTTLLDIWVVAYIIAGSDCMRRATPAEVALIGLAFFHMNVRVQWHWGVDDMFKMPTEAYTLHLRAASNFAYLIALCVVYREQGDTSPEASHGNRTQAART